MAAGTTAFTFQLRVRWAETDPQGVVFNAHYLTYLDVVVTECMRAAGLAYPDRLKELGVDMFLAHSAVDYRNPARFDDELTLRVTSVTAGNTSLTWLIDVLRADEVVATGKLVYVTVDDTGRRPVPVPPVVREKLTTSDE